MAIKPDLFTETIIRNINVDNEKTWLKYSILSIEHIREEIKGYQRFLKDKVLPARLINEWITKKAKTDHDQLSDGYSDGTARLLELVLIEENINLSKQQEAGVRKVFKLYCDETDTKRTKELERVFMAVYAIWRIHDANKRKGSPDDLASYMSKASKLNAVLDMLSAENQGIKNH